jgi:hypothetical protein
MCENQYERAARRAARRSGRKELERETPGHTIGILLVAIFLLLLTLGGVALFNATVGV